MVVIRDAPQPRGTRYRLPEALGAGEHEPAAFHGADVGFDLPGVRDRLWLNVGDLTEVKPALPPEPPNFSTVRVGKAAFVRNDGSGGANWYGPGGWLGWPALCETAMTDTGFPPVLLVPDPLAEAPHLPFTAHDEGDHDIRVSAGREGLIPVSLLGGTGTGTSYLTPANARLAGLALLKAAQQQEA